MTPAGLLALFALVSTLPAPPADPPPAPVELTYPGKAWSLVLDLRDFEVGPPRTRSDGTRVSATALHEESGLVVSISLEEATSEGDALAYRARFWKQLKRAGPEGMRRVKRSERGEIALLEYVVPKVQGLELNQKNVHALLARDGVWIDVHLSKVQFETERDAPLFEVVLRSVRLQD